MRNGIDIAAGGSHFHRLGAGRRTVAKVEIYTKAFCPYCARAKSLLTSKNVNIEEIDITMDSGLRNAMIARAHGHSTVPQIFIDGQYIGGSDDLAALDAKGGLDPLLAR
jgi:glutaredoxin 3